MLNYSAIPVIVVICYIAITAIKTTKINSKFYPLISCILGALLAAAMFFIFPEFIGAATLTAAIISGCMQYKSTLKFQLKFKFQSRFHLLVS